MGMLDEIPNINRGYFKIDKRTKVLLYTDGLVEVLSGDDVETGTSDIEKALRNKDSISDNIQQIIQSQGLLKDNVNIFDDISMLGFDFQ